MDRIACVAVLFLLWGCSVAGGRPEAPMPPLLSQAQHPTVISDEDLLPWGKEEEYVIVVSKACRVLHLYHYGVRIKSYPVVLGQNPTGRKLYAGDRRTPTGLYAIIDKKPHRKWSRFLLLDYPTQGDVHTYWQAMGSERGHRLPGVGGGIGIHGTDEEKLNRLGINWTWGCISMLNPDVEELYDRVPLGTFVYIEE